VSDFMKSPFVKACQSTLDQDAINSQRLSDILTQGVADPSLWPEDLRLWTAELLETRMMEFFDDMPEPPQ